MLWDVSIWFGFAVGKLNTAASKSPEFKEQSATPQLMHSSSFPFCF